MAEFEIIEKYFVPLTMGHESAAGLQDDAAVLDIPDGHELVVTSDTLNEGVHFLKGESPENIARKALRVNLSDLAAMAATPLCYQLNIAFPEKPEAKWLKAFCDALYDDNKAFNIFCSGGDTTGIKGDDLSISITAMGTVPKGGAVRRGGAQKDDVIIVTGPVGDAALGLKVLQEGLDQKLYKKAVERYRVPQPRTGLADILREFVHGAADISDGLLADCLHIARASGLGAEIDVEKIAFSMDVQRGIDENAMPCEQALTGGDDYELILAVSESDAPKVLSELQKRNLNPMIIGCFKDSALGLNCINSGRFQINLQQLGWKHL